MASSNKNTESPFSPIYRKRALFVNANFKKRGFSGIYCENSKEAVKKICDMIPDGSLVALGGSMSVIDSGLIDGLREKNIELLDRYKEGVTKEETDKMREKGMQADVLIASCNAITFDGLLVNEDGFGNRVAGMIYGPKKVILIAGMNKIVQDEEAAVSRIKNHVAPVNCIRLGRKTPCAETGFCDDSECFLPERICGQLVFIESNPVPGRMNIVLVGEELGY